MIEEMNRRFQFRLSTLFWAMFMVAVFSGSWQIVRCWSNADPVEAALAGAPISIYILMGAYAFVIYLNMPLDD